MTDEKLIEAMARAICEAYPIFKSGWDEQGGVEKAIFRNVARAALAAPGEDDDITPEKVRAIQAEADKDLAGHEWEQIAPAAPGEGLPKQIRDPKEGLSAFKVLRDHFAAPRLIDALGSGKVDADGKPWPATTRSMVARMSAEEFEAAPLADEGGPVLVGRYEDLPAPASPSPGLEAALISARKQMWEESARADSAEAKLNELSTRKLHPALQVDVQQHRNAAYQNGWDDGYAEGYGKAKSEPASPSPEKNDD